MKRILAISLFICALFPAIVSYAQSSVCTSAYISDPNGPVTNIRANPKGTVIQEVPTNWSVELVITSPTNGWWKIVDSEVFDPGYEDVKIKHGYIHYSCLEQGTRNYDQQLIHLRQTPSASGKIVCSLGETSVRPIDISADGKWVKVMTIDRRYTGWIEKTWLCGNPVTNCC